MTEDEIHTSGSPPRLMSPECVRASDLLQEFHTLFGRDDAPNAVTNATIFEIIKGVGPRASLLAIVEAIATSLRERVTEAMLGPKLAAMSAEERTENWHRELAEALPILEELVPKARELLRVVRSQDDYEARKLAIVERWNEEVARDRPNGRWEDMAPLCEYCAQPVYQRGIEKLKSEGGQKNWKHSTKHGGRCKTNAKSARAAMRKKLKG